MRVLADKCYRVAPPRFHDGPADAATVLEKGAAVRAKQKRGSTNYWKGIIHDVNHFSGTYDVKWWGHEDADCPVRRLVPPKDILTAWEGWGEHPLAPPAVRIVQAAPASASSPRVRVMTASDGGGAVAQAAKRVRGGAALGGVDAPGVAAECEPVPVQVGEVVMLEHLGIESMEVLPAPPPAPGVVDDMADRMVFTVAYIAQKGDEPSTMRISLKDMVHSDTNIHLNALVDHMKLLSLGNPTREDFDELFPGVEPFPVQPADALRLHKQLSRHAACRDCQHCKEKAREAVPDCPCSEEEESDSSSQEEESDSAAEV